VIAGARKRQLDGPRTLGVVDVLAIDDDEAIEKLRSVDAIGDTVAGQVATKLLAKVKLGGSFGDGSTLPDGGKAQHPAVKTMRVRAARSIQRARVCGRRARRQVRSACRWPDGTA
jgi:hypothetical protein